MGKVFKILGKVLLYLFLFIVVVLICGCIAYFAIIIEKWQWWVALALDLGFIGILFGIYFIKKYLQRKRQKKFVQNIIKEDEKRIDISKSEGFIVFEEEWRQSVEKLRKSYLAKFGNPIYHLPWFLCIGHIEAGKKSALKNTEINSSLSDTDYKLTEKHCTWWFFEKSIVLCMAGKYIKPEKYSIEQQWQKFLELLIKQRKKEPLNGIVIFVSSDMLLSENEKVLRDYGQDIRRKIGQLINIIGFKFPVYIMISKMDNILGFSDFCNLLTNDQLSTAMGYVNKNFHNNLWSTIIEKTFKNTINIISDIRKNAICLKKDLKASVITFPEEFSKLRAPLYIFLKSIFEEDKYLETPFLRGIFFSSSIQKNDFISSFLEKSGLTLNETTKSEKESKSIFLKDFFNKILPQDRGLVFPIKSFLSWRRITKSTGLLAFIFIMIFLSGLLVSSYLDNLKVIRDYAKIDCSQDKKYSKSSQLLLSLFCLKTKIEEIDSLNKSQFLPRIGLNQSSKASDWLKEKYVEKFGKELLEPFDIDFIDKSKTFEDNAPNAKTAIFLDYLIARISVMKQKIAGKSLDDFESMKGLKNVTTKVILDISDIHSTEIASLYFDLYIAYLKWSKNDIDIKSNLAEFKETLISLFEKKGENLKWLIDVLQTQQYNITLKEFWYQNEIYENIPEKEQIYVAGVFTTNGRKFIKHFIKLLTTALPDEKRIDKRINIFWKWYKTYFFAKWFSFAQNFNLGVKYLPNYISWQEMATRMTNDENPYFKLIEKMGDEFQIYKDDNDIPLWAKQILIIDKVLDIAKQLDKKNQTNSSNLSGKLKVVEDKAKFAIFSLLTEKDKAQADKYLKYSDAMHKYINSLNKIAAVIPYEEKYFNMFSDFVDTSSKTKSQLDEAYNAFVNMKHLQHGFGLIPFCWNLLYDPISFLMEFGVRQGSYILQNKWKETVIGSIYGVDSSKVSDILFKEKSGSVWKFVNGVAKPYISQGKNGYYARKTFDVQIPFKNNFFKFLNKGAKSIKNKKSEYDVTFKTVPLSVNDGAKVEPYQSVLTLHCAKKVQKLNNTNFLQTKSFTWTPETCGDVTLDILFPNESLSYNYKGYLGFPKFLNDFKFGYKTFYAKDFSSKKSYLKSNNISSITLTYDITGGLAVKDFLKIPPRKIPTNIINLPSYSTKVSDSDKKKSKKKGKAKKPTYKISLTTIPIEVNDQAKSRPYESILTLDCVKNLQKLKNMNFPKTQYFNYKSNSCGKTTIDILFPSITLTYEYSGKYGFLKFLEDFSKQSKTFSLNDFPNQKTQLEKLGVTTITLAYKISGQDALLKSFSGMKTAKQNKKKTSQKTKGKIKKKKTNDSNKIRKKITKKNTNDTNTIQTLGKATKQSTKDSNKKKPRGKISKKKTNDSNTKTSSKNNNKAKIKIKKPKNTKPESIKAKDIKPNNIKPKSIKDTKWILKQNSNNYTLQIMSLTSINDLESNLKKDKINVSEVAYYKTKSGQKSWYIIIFGNFSSENQAKEAIIKLPQFLQKAKPIVRKMSLVQEEITKGIYIKK